MPKITTHRDILKHTGTKHRLTSPPNAQLFVATLCPQSVLHGLTDLLKSGRLARLEIINVDVSPGVAAALGIRSTPWFRIGPFDLSGAMSKAELSQARADACHFLALAGHADAIPNAQRLLNDEDPDVRSVAAETLAFLGDDSACSDAS